jgi:S-adenosylmethionine decarboxylase
VDAQLRLGEHIICDFSHCNRDLLYDPDRARLAFSRAVRASGLTVLEETFHAFAPHGFSCLLLLAESHASLHAWPEHGYVAIDLFTCNLEIDLAPLIQELQAAFEAQASQVMKINRLALAEHVHA